MKNQVRRVVLLAAVCMLSADGLRSQAQGPETRFRAGVDLVSLNVVATDGRDRFAGGLTATDFAVFEDGVPQDVSFFSASAVPIDLALVLGCSSSMIDKMRLVQEAATGFVSRVRPGDRVTIVAIKDDVKRLHPLDEDIPGALAAIKDTFARGGTALYNGIYMTLREMERLKRDDGEVRRQAILVLSDGDDTTSLIGFEDVMDAAKRSGIVIYTITLRTEFQRLLAQQNKKPAVTGEFAMRSFAQETGARAFFPSSAGELTSVYGMIENELANLYSIGYVSTNTRRDGSYRRVTVRVNQPGIRARTRNGYIASSRPIAEVSR
jgi:Ca-activated chloride channel family protein